MFVLPIRIPHREHFFTKGFGKCIFYTVLSEQVAEMVPLGAAPLQSQQPGDSVAFCSWHQSPSSSWAHTHHSCQLWAHGAAHPVLTAWGYTKTMQPKTLLPRKQAEQILWKLPTPWGTICNESVTLQFMGTASDPVDKTVPGTLGAVAMVPPQPATSPARSKRPGEVAGVRHSPAIPRHCPRESHPGWNGVGCCWQPPRH